MDTMIGFPKVELHLHLDGAIRYETAWQLANSKKIDLGYPTIEAFKNAVITRQSSNLGKVLEAFHIFMPAVIGDPKAIERVSYELCEDQAKCNVVYFEGRFNPQFMSNTCQSAGMEHKTYDGQGAVDPDMVVQAVLRGLKRGEHDFGVKARAILCCISGHSHWSKEVLALALKYRAQGVVGIDIAGCASSGDKEVYEVINQEVFKEAKEAGLHRTVHAGEAGTYLNVKNALDQLYAERIGHGYHALDNDQLYKRMVADRVHFEVCPTSSRCTGAYTGDWASHPAKRLATDGGNFGISTDDPTCFDINLNDEWLLAREKIGLTVKQLQQCQLDAAEAAFLPEKEKAEIVAKIKAAM